MSPLTQNSTIMEDRSRSKGILRQICSLEGHGPSQSYLLEPCHCARPLPLPGCMLSYSLFSPPHSTSSQLSNDLNLFFVFYSLSFYCIPCYLILFPQGFTTIVRYHGGRLSTCLMELYPDIGLKKIYFNPGRVKKPTQIAAMKQSHVSRVSRRHTTPSVGITPPSPSTPSSLLTCL